MLPPGAIFKLKIHKNAFAAGATGGKYRAPPDPRAGLQRAALRQESGMGRRRRKREGVSVPHFFFYNLTIAQQCIVAATYTRSLDLFFSLGVA